MHKIIKIILLVIGGVGTVLFFQLPSMDAPLAEAVNSGSMALMFNIAYLLLAVSIVVTLVFGLMNVFTSKGGLKNAIIIIGGFLVVFIISYVLAKGTDVNFDELAKNGVPATESLVKWIGTGLNMFFILMIVAIGALVAGGFKKMTNK